MILRKTVFTKLACLFHVIVNISFSYHLFIRKQQTFKNQILESYHLISSVISPVTIPSSRYWPRVQLSFEHIHRRTGRHFTGGAEKICPENNNFPWK